jgi:hypothetical protein
MTAERRSTPFQEWLSRFMVRSAAAGAMWVLVDPRLTITSDGSIGFVMNSGAFSTDLKGAVISAILIGGFTSVREYWLGSSKTGQEQAQSMSRIAEAAPSVAAAVVAAATEPAKADTVNVDATGGNVNIKD